jgi:deoxycytidine triphosphate deaminase
MFLSDREMAYAISTGRLIVDPPTEIGPTSIDLHLDKVEEAKVWNTDALKKFNTDHGHPPLELRIAQAKYGAMAKLYHSPPPTRDGEGTMVFARGREIVVKPGGFVLWQTRERVGTPNEDADLMCFIEGKSTRARTGLLIHMTAPTIHAGWCGNVTLEIGNFGPFHIVLAEGDVVAQITVAQISSIPRVSMEKSGSATIGQRHVSGGGN